MNVFSDEYLQNQIESGSPGVARPAAALIEIPEEDRPWVHTAGVRTCNISGGRRSDRIIEAVRLYQRGRLTRARHDEDTARMRAACREADRRMGFLY